MDTKKVQISKSAKVADLNDRFRQSMMGCNVSRGIINMNYRMHDLFSKVRSYSDFNENNDPYHEHDFGSLEIEGVKVFWKIDYYNESLTSYEDPLSSRCRRVMTIMKAEEY